VFCLAVNLVLVLILVQPFRAAGLGLANTVTAYINMGLLTYGLRRKLGRLDFGELRSSLLALVGSTLLAGLIAWGASRVWQLTLGHGTLWLRMGAVFVPMTLAGAAYCAVALWAKIPAARDLLHLIGTKFHLP
jgi:peptidoglycan biosynthesis protein MviN/MurJ (putative lipid II flippase)